MQRSDRPGASAQGLPDLVVRHPVEEPQLDLGTVVAGESVTATFIFHNDGPEDVNIIRAKPS